MFVSVRTNTVPFSYYPLKVLLTFPLSPQLFVGGSAGEFNPYYKWGAGTIRIDFGFGLLKKKAGIHFDHIQSNLLLFAKGTCVSISGAARRQETQTRLKFFA